jgi:oligopeptidase A
MNTTSNPLLADPDSVGFGTIRAEHLAPALDVLLADAQAALEHSVSDAVPADYDAMARALDVPVERLTVAWGRANHLHAVADTPELRAAVADNLPRVTQFFTSLASDERLYAKYKQMVAARVGQPAASAQDKVRAKVLADALRAFRLGGAELQGPAKERFAAIQSRLADLGQSFGEHVLDATDGYAHYASAEQLAGLPADILAATREAAAADGHEGHKLTLHAPVYIPVLQFVADRNLRETLFRAYQTRASDLGPAELDNTAIVHEMLQLRAEAAELLGYPSYADVSLATKMARSPAEVSGFVRDLARRARPFAERELAELREHAARECGIADLQAWDRPYVSEKLKQQRYAFSSTEVKQYFTAPKVVTGLFALIERLLGVQIREAPQPAWHASVGHHEVLRGGEVIASFFLDLYARNGKQPGAWMDNARQRWQRPDTAVLQRPVAHLVCNFAPPTAGSPSLLTHDDVVTLFHEFGHGLHHLLTRVDDYAVSGIAGVEWDAVELPSQFMENFCWEYEVLAGLSGHVETGEPLPTALFDRMKAARNFGNGLALIRHCEFSLFDMLLHVEPEHRASPDGALQLARAVAAELSPAAPPDFIRYAVSFSHLFDGGYAAGYYGYAWAEVLSADAYSAFEEAGIFDPATGARWREQVLEVGGSRPAMDSFQAFRGRAPTLDAMLRHQGLHDAQAAAA